MPRNSQLPGQDGLDEIRLQEDLISETTLTRGVVSQYLDYSKRRFHATNVPETASGLDLAIQRALSVEGIFHPDVLDLPLADIKARRWGKKVKLDLRYRRYWQRWSLSPPRQDPLEVAVFRGKYRSVKVYGTAIELDEEDPPPPYNANGYPEGEFYDRRLKEGWAPWTLGTVDYRQTTLPIVEVYVSTVLGFHPYRNGIAALQGRLNADPFTLAGFDFPAGTIRFDNADVDWFEAWDANGRPFPMFAIDYKFTLGDPYSWVDQTVVFDRIDREWKYRYTKPPQEGNFNALIFE